MTLQENHEPAAEASGAQIITSSSAPSAELVTFNFHGDDLDVVRAGTEVYGGIRAACDALGVNFASQLQKLRGTAWATVAVIATVAADGKKREVACLPLRALPMWLTTIHPSKVGPAVREKLELYQRDAAEVLADHFIGKRGEVKPGLLIAPGLRTETVTVTPEMAAEWLKHRNARNRPLRERIVNRYVADLKAGKWATTHQGLAFGPDGEMIDGQHRLAAIVKAGVSAVLLVTHYASAEAALAVKLKCDTGRPKSKGDVFTMVGLHGGERLAALVQALRAIEGHSEDMTADEMQEIYFANRAAVDWSLATLESRGFTARDRAAFAFAYTSFPEQVEVFALAVKNVDAPAGSPASSYLKARAAGAFITSGAHASRRDVMLRILRLIMAHVRREKGPSRLFASTEAVEFFRKQTAKREKVLIAKVSP